MEQPNQIERDVAERYDWELRHVFQVTRRGVVDGVEVDLVRGGLGSTEWMPARGWRIWDGAAGSIGHLGPGWRRDPFDVPPEGPWLIFPWHEDQGRKHYSKNDLSTILQRGDRLEIEFLDRVRVGAELSPPADRDAIDAKLIVNKANGRRVRPNRPLRFYHRDSLLDPQAPVPYFGIVASRLCEAMGVVSLSDHAPSERGTIIERLKRGSSRVRRWRLDTLHSHRRLRFDEAAFKAAMEVERSLEWLGETEGWMIESRVRQIINQAVEMGYLAARAEAAEHLAPRAVAAFNRDRDSKRNGQLGGARKAEIADRWRRTARLELRKLASEPGPHKRMAMVAKVRERWPATAMPAPSSTSIGDLLREMERAGEVQLQTLHSKTPPSRKRSARED